MPDLPRHETRRPGDEKEGEYVASVAGDQGRSSPPAEDVPARSSSPAQGVSGRSPRRRGSRGVRPKTVIWWGVAIILIALVLLAIWYLTRRGDGSVPLLDAPADATSTITFAGVFPPPGEDRLKSPTGIAVETTTVYVSEAGAGAVREFSENGARLRTLRVPRARGAATVSPGSVAIADGVLAVIDTAAEQVVLFDLDTGGVRGRMPIGRGRSRLARPTAITSVEEGFIVADAADGMLKTFSPDGTPERSERIVATVPVRFVSGLAHVGDRLVLADSSGRLLIVDDPASAAQVIDRAFVLPKGVAPGPDPTTLVIKVLARSITQLDDAGEIVGQAGTRQGAAMPSEGLLGLPREVAWMEPTGRAYVTDVRAGDIKVYNVAVVADNE